MTEKLADPTTSRVLRFPEVKMRVGYCRMHIDRLEKAGKFPTRVQLGPNSVGWVEHEVNAWLQARIKARDTQPANDSASAFERRQPPARRRRSDQATGAQASAA